LLSAAERNPTTGSTYGVGQLLVAALDSGAKRVVVGLGGSATNDGGRGMLGALGLREFTDGRVDRSGLDPRLSDVELVAASDVDNPLLGPQGATLVFAPQKGADAETVAVLEARMRRWSNALDADAVTRPGAGAAGGLGYALFVVGAERVSGVQVVAEATGLPERLSSADLVVTGEGSFDEQSLRGKVCAGVAERAQRAGLPCVVLAGQVRIGREAVAAAGLTAAYSVAHELGSVDAALANPAGGLVRLAERVAAAWPAEP
jgi:glycerate kinase